MDWVIEIRKLGEERKLSDAQLAAELGLSKQYLSDVLTRKTLPSTKLKLKVWSRREYDLDRNAILSLLPSKVSEQLLEIEIKRGVSRAEKLISNSDSAKDWVDQIIQLRDERGLSDTQFAAELGVSQPFLSSVLNRKKEVSWPLKVAIWSRKGYDLSRDALLNFLPKEVAIELKELDLQRGRERAEKLKK